MSKVIQFGAPVVKGTKAPEYLFRLRWRLVSTSGVQVISAWTPETRYPSVTRTIDEFAGKVGAVHIDAVSLRGDTRMTPLRVDGAAFKGMTYKGGLLASDGRPFVAGIEVEDIEGNRYLVQRDGTVHVERPKGSRNVANDN